MPELQVRSLKKGHSRRQYKCLTLDCIQLDQEMGCNQTEMSFFCLQLTLKAGGTTVLKQFTGCVPST